MSGDKRDRAFFLFFFFLEFYFIAIRGGSSAEYQGVKLRRRVTS